MTYRIERVGMEADPYNKAIGAAGGPPRSERVDTEVDPYS